MCLAKSRWIVFVEWLGPYSGIEKKLHCNLTFLAVSKWRSSRCHANRFYTCCTWVTMELLKNFLIALWRDEDLVTSKSTVLGGYQFIPLIEKILSPHHFSNRCNRLATRKKCQFLIRRLPGTVCDQTNARKSAIDVFMTHLDGIPETRTVLWSWGYPHYALLKEVGGCI